MLDLSLLVKKKIEKDRSIFWAKNNSDKLGSKYYKKSIMHYQVSLPPTQSLLKTNIAISLLQNWHASSDFSYHSENEN